MNGVYEKHTAYDSFKMAIIHHPLGEDDPIHWHENIEILYFFEGAAVVLNGSEEIRADKGDVIVVNSKDIHSVKRRISAVSYCCLIIDCNFCKSMGFDINNNYFCKKIKDEKINAIFENMLAEKENQNKYWFESLRIGVLSVLLSLFREYITDDYIDSRSSPKVKIAKTVLRYLREHFKEPVSIEDIENNCDYTRYYISRVFKEITGATIMTYLNDLRIKEAKSMLAKTDFDINKISNECGFDNQSYFGKVFKKRVGCSPLEFRKGEQIW